MVKKSLMYVNLCLIFWCVSCQSEKKEKTEAATFNVTSPLVKDTLIDKEYVAQIRSINHIELRAQEKGYIQSIYVDEGQSVKKGQLLFKIMPNLYESDVNRARAEAKYAEIEYQNTKNLSDKNIVAPQEMAMAKARYDKAKAELASTDTHLKFTEIRAPFSGIVGKLHVRKGSLVDDGELITELSDNSKMWVYFNVPEAEYLNQMTDRKNELLHVRLKMANGKEFSQQGVVETIESDFDNETGNIAYRATFLNPNGLLRYGETGNILITSPYPNAVMIPQKATFEELEKKYVYVITKDNKVKAREIKVAAELPHIYVVASGLGKDDRILLDGLRLVQENQKINSRFQKPEKVMSNLDLYAE
ncbi:MULTISPECIES: efflux RND transporter periplasmic adaptor subunit [Chryseobacterium]|uniref:Membrane fusion protein (Multidrug efflux system) n=2 Tax=Chryseobacterium TaxID=59732 RepID=A0ABU0TJ98_9FLAO|nr:MULTISPECIES: efflux RND transporter periplasmic adaptor subunit [Chryseobacterium]MDQ1096886.1 membrane fusion protein (multidrug efflux system) [Chryseobacterium camelliae]MDQ1100828.1 membrane fusion protein (multidrug efflux system) [Chryseobacterium sp. SORGH_AS_1048]MDR6132542.1 membrane fusion protein (multidrug efflux system) [Chryseobacterium sp. SORGH_AS_1175]MDT3409251.1 membrane fusion protein (multidrug efflux system) [Pseudacidovorax intermedius]